jgi:hypothetical protein
VSTKPTYDTLDDELMTALGVVCFRRINEAMDLVEGDAIRTVYTFPITIDLIPSVKTPALAIYRTQTQFAPHGPVGVHWNDSIRIDYIAPKTRQDKLGERWPLLHQVTKELLAALCSGKVDGVDHFENVGVVHLDRSKYIVRYTYAQNDSFAWPMFETSFPLEWEPQVDEALIDATELLAQQLRDDKTAGDSNPFIVTSLHTLPIP